MEMSDMLSRSPAMHSGLRHLSVYDPESQTSFPAIVQYPTAGPSSGTQVGPYHFDATEDAPLASGKFPVCVISHGGGGSHLLYRSIATHLAKNGHIVVCPEHPGDNRNDNSLSNTDTAAANRPRQASLAIDSVQESPFFSGTADASRISAIGHSMGGYTALAMAGGHPWTRSGQPLAVQKDPRIGAAVLMAPSLAWFMAPGALDDVTAPLLVLAGGQDQITPLPIIRQALDQISNRSEITLQVVEGAGHFSFLSPFPTHMRRADFPPSSDPEGFDRDAFHEKLPQVIYDFLSKTFGPR